MREITDKWGQKIQFGRAREFQLTEKPGHPLWCLAVIPQDRFPDDRIALCLLDEHALADLQAEIEAARHE